jgi:signal-transduction protein with cAMP-binding, CBS, and nucleotidyltransferase domain
MKAAKAMDDREVSSILVKTHDEFSGIITDRDIIKRVVSKGLDPTKVSVHEVMSSPIVTISSEATIDEAAKKMADNHLRRLVVEQDQRKIGLIAESDLMRVDSELHFLIRERSKLEARLTPTVPQEVTLAGFCEECGNYSPRLKKVDGEWLDEDCRDQ